MGYLLRPTYRVSAGYNSMTLDTACWFWYIRTNKESNMIPDYTSKNSDTNKYNLPTLPEGEVVHTIDASGGLPDNAQHGPGKWLWSSALRVPKIGDFVEFKISGTNFGTGRVRAYYTESGWLGLHVERHTPHIDFRGKSHNDAFVFGLDIKKHLTTEEVHFNKALRDARTTTDPNLLEILSHDPSVAIVLSVIGNLATTHATLRELSKHRDPEVRHAVLRELSVRDIEPLPENYISAYHALEAIYNDVESFLNGDMDMDFNDLFAAIRDTASEVLH